MTSRIGLGLLCFILLMALPACGWGRRVGPNTLVIAVENLAFEDVSCESDDLAGREFESFRLFCEDGVRFTHAYTTSTMSQPALASLLTGFYPLEHGVRTNGRDALSAKLDTVAEVAARRGFRTALISGGPPILRKSGLSQGFEVFDDNFPVPPLGLYRPAHEVSRIFLNWLDRSINRETFFSVLYLADLQFPEAATVSDLGEVRERSQASQVREVAEALSSLIRALRERGLWHRTHVVLVGLGGGSSSRPGEIAPLNLYGENTQVALFLKPARPTQDQGPQWTIDKNVSLSDVGKSLFELVGGEAPGAPLTQLPRVSLQPLLLKPKADWSDDRLILIESSWGSWRWLSPTRYAARRQQYFYVHDAVPKIYNTLLDRLELIPMPKSDPLWTTLDQGILSFFNQLEIQPWRVQDQVMWQKTLAAKQWWSLKTSMQKVPFEGLNLNDAQTRRWMAARLLAQEDWTGLAKFAEEHKESLYNYVARRNLNLNARVPAGSCARLFRPNRPLPSENSCNEEMFELLIDVVSTTSRDRRERQMEIFLRRYNSLLWEREVGVANYTRFLPWDVSITWPHGASLSDLFLSLPENRVLRDEVKGRRSRENRALDL